MQELVQKAVDLARGMWRRRWIGLGVAWIVALIGVLAVYRFPERYEASARVYVDTESLLRPLMAGLAIQPNLDQQVALISRTLISRPNVEKLIRLADLDLGARTTAEQDSLIDAVSKSIKLEGNATSNLYVLTYRDSNPNQARKVVQSMLTIFVESSLGDKRQDTQAAVKFLDDQIKSYEQNLMVAENKIKDFKIKYMGVAGNGQGQNYFERVNRLNADIELAKLDLESAEKARDAYRRELSGEQFPDLLAEAANEGSMAVPELDARITALKRDLDTLLRKYTEQHPDVMAVERMIKQLEEERDVTRKKLAQNSAKNDARSPQNMVAQQIKLALADAEAAVASTRAKLSGLENQQRALKAQAQQVPQAEAEYTQLVRDYDVQRKTYESLLARRESALMGKDVQNTGGAQFRVIDPPRVSPQPVAPNRIALLGVVVVLSIAAGLFGSLVASELMPTFHTARRLREFSKRPILGMISMLPSVALNRTRRRLAWFFAGGVSALFASFAAVFVFALMIGRPAI